MPRARSYNRRVRLLGVLALAGCNSIYGLEETEPRTLEPSTCSTVVFGATRPLDEFRGGDTEFDGQLSRDGLEIWFTVGDRIHRGTRAARSDEFTITPFAQIPEPSNDPALTADGNRMMFFHVDQPRRVFEGVRLDPMSSTFDSIRPVTSIDLATGEFGVQSLDLSWDGLTVYYVAGDNDTLYWARRPSRDAAFEEHAPLLDMSGMPIDDAVWPSISADQLELFYNRRADPDIAKNVYHRVRSSPTGRFSEENVILIGADPDISPDGQSLIVSQRPDLVVLDRICPGI
jgi:hypothetical protein